MLNRRTAQQRIYRPYWWVDCDSYHVD